MSDFVDVAGIEEVPEGSVRAIAAHGHDLLVARVGDRVLVQL